MDLDAVTILDTAAAQPDPPPRLVRDGKPRYHATPHAGRVLVRDPAGVDGICVHQTACTFGPAGDIARRHDRAHDVPIHALAFRDGTLALPYPPSWYLFHGNGWNARSLGLEIEGRYAGVEHDDASRPAVRADADSNDLRATWRRTDDELDDVTIATARRGIRELVERGRAAGMPIRYVWAHRQSSASRRADPGSAIWRHVVLDYAVAVLGLETQIDVTLGDGARIPREWDPAASAKY